MAKTVGRMRILAVDHGEKRIGLALSDPTSTIASPLTVVKHTSRLLDAAQVADIAQRIGRHVSRGSR